jgi:hypothetical protein
MCYQVEMILLPPRYESVTQIDDAAPDPALASVPVLVRFLVLVFIGRP